MTTRILLTARTLQVVIRCDYTNACLLYVPLNVLGELCLCARRKVMAAMYSIDHISRKFSRLSGKQFGAIKQAWVIVGRLMKKNHAFDDTSTKIGMMTP